MTGDFRVGLHKQLVSIHTPTQGVTADVGLAMAQGIGFNPHTHAGCDNDKPIYSVSSSPVSIHTPTQGVTLQK